MHRDYRMKLSTLKDKRYGSMHMFATHFLTGYSTPAFKLHHKALIQHSFRHIEHKFFKYKHNTPFFNYPWLLRKLLTKHDLLEYLPYVKPIRCGKRNSYYEDMFSRIMI